MNEVKADRLVPLREGMRSIGVRSATTFYKLVSAGELPALIKRGTRSFLLESDLQRYIAKLAATREVS